MNSQIAPDILIIEETEEETELEPLYRILIHNDHVPQWILWCTS